VSPETRQAPEEGWDSLTVDELQEQLEARGLKKSGNKAELVSRLEEYARSDQSPDATRQGEGADEEGSAEEAVEETTPAPRRSAETVTEPKAAPREDDGAVVISARARYVRGAPRKARLVMGHIRGKPVDQARSILGYGPRSVSAEILKLLDSAVANAETNYELSADELRVRGAYVDEGPTIKRYRPRALGRATRINKRTSHMTIELTTSEGN
jgi:large subunit ribosomal protein L22